MLAAQYHSLIKLWDWRFGGLLNDDAAVLIGTSDSNYILLGSSFSGVGGNKTQNNWDTSFATEDFWVVKFNSWGEKIWDRRYGGFSEDGPSLYSLHEIKSGGYIMGGFSTSGVSGDKTEPDRGGQDYWIIKIDSVGNKIWDKTFGGSQDEIFGSIQITADGGYILGGTSYSDSSGDKTQNSRGGTDYWVVKTDSLGNKQWDKRFGGFDYDFMLRVIQTKGGGYVLGGVSASSLGGDKTAANFGGYDYWVIKIDSAGNKVWDASFGGSYDEELESLLQTGDGGYILAGWSASSISGNKSSQVNGGEDYWIVKIDSMGNKQWDSDFGGTDDDRLFNLIQTQDGGFLLSGNSMSPQSYDKTENNIGAVQTWLLKTDSLGKKQWDKTILVDAPADVANSIQTSDGCYVVASFTAANAGYYKSQSAINSSSDYWVIKFCDTIVTTVNEITPNLQFSVYPNPFVTDLAISMQKDNLKEATFTITNLLGQTIYTQHETNLSTTYTKMLDLSYLPNGVYFLEVVVDGERMVREVVKQ